MTVQYLKRIAFAPVIIVCALGALFHMSSCQKTDVTPPYVFFDSIPGYVYEDTALQHGTIFTVYIIAEKAGRDQLITSGQISRRINGGPDSVLQTMTLATQQFAQFYSYTAAGAGNKETYIFTFSQLDGLTDSAKVTVTDL